MNPELEKMMNDGLAKLQEGQTIVMVFEDMYQVNDHFQAVIDWFNENGLKTRRRYGQGVFMQRGMVYFVGADTHCTIDEEGNELTITTRGAVKDYDMRPYASELVRKIGLGGKLAKKREEAKTNG